MLPMHLSYSVGHLDKVSSWCHGARHERFLPGTAAARRTHCGIHLWGVWLVGLPGTQVHEHAQALLRGLRAVPAPRRTHWRVPGSELRAGPTGAVLQLRFPALKPRARLLADDDVWARGLPAHHLVAPGARLV